MKLPNAGKVIVERRKIVDYLLNPAHRYGAGKAGYFFVKFGFQAKEWEQLAREAGGFSKTIARRNTRARGAGSIFSAATK